MRIENIFEDISKGKRKFNDFLNEIKPWEDYISRVWLKEIHQKKAELIAAELKTQHKLSTLLQKIRGDKAEESEMERLLDNFNRENSCSLMSIERFLKEKRNITSKIGIFKDIIPEKNLLKEITTIEDLLSNYYELDVYLLHISEKWQTEDKANSSKQLRYFKTLINSEKIVNDGKSNDTPINSACIVIDYDLHSSDLEHDENKANKCCIYYAKRGTIKSKDYYEDSLNYVSRVWLNEIDQKRTQLIGAELKTQRELSTLLQKIRG
ncbi:unnamed protein product, partial [Rotaria sp. Silwood1]